MSRCFATGKVCYPSRGRAYKAVSTTPFRAQRAYRCEHCNRYHLTSQRVAA